MKLYWRRYRITAVCRAEETSGEEGEAATVGAGSKEPLEAVATDWFSNQNNQNNK
jgi:hypothetical protein